MSGLKRNKGGDVGVEITKARDGFRWRFIRGGRIVGESGEAYSSKSKAKRAVESLLRALKGGKWRWVLSLIALTLLTVLTPDLQAASVRLAWNPYSDPVASELVLHYGTNIPPHLTAQTNAAGIPTNYVIGTPIDPSQLPGYTRVTLPVTSTNTVVTNLTAGRWFFFLSGKAPDTNIGPGLSSATSNPVGFAQPATSPVMQTGISIMTASALTGPWSLESVIGYAFDTTEPAKFYRVALNAPVPAMPQTTPPPSPGQ